MAKKIKHSDLFEPKLFEPTIKESRTLLKLTSELTNGFKDLLKVQQKKVKGNLVTTAKDIKNLNTQTKDFITTEKQLKKVQEAETKIKIQLKAATDEEVKGKIRLQAVNKAQKDILKDQLILEDKQAGTLQKLNALNRKLRREREKLNLDTEKGRKRLKAINAELDKNNKRVKDNSDALKKQRLNVGNYTESIKEAAGASGLFGGVLGKLAAIQGTISALTKKSTVETGAATVATEAQAVATVQLTIAQRALAAATGLASKGFKILKVALISSGVGVLLIALGSLVAFFTRSQAGVDGLAGAFSGLGAAVDVIIDRFSAVGEGLVKIISGIKNLSADEIKAGIEDIGEAFKGVGDELQREVKLATELKNLTIELTREQKLFSAEQATSLTRTKELTLIVKDKLRADQDRLEAVKEINKIETATAEKQLELQERALAAALDSISADKTKLQLGAEQLDFIERIKTGQIEAAEAVKLAADFTLSSAAGEEALFDIVEKIVAQEQARQNLLDKQATTAKRTASIVKEIATKEAKALIELSKLRLLFAKDEKEIIATRIKAFEEARDFQIQSFKTQADANIINEKEFQTRRLEIIKITEQEIAKLGEKAVKKEEKEDPSIEAARKKASTINDIEQEQLDQRITALSEATQKEIDIAFLADEEIRGAKLEGLLASIDEEFNLRKRAAEDQTDFLLTNDKLTAEQRELLALQLQGDIAEIERQRVDTVEDVNQRLLDREAEGAKDRGKELADSLSDLADTLNDFFKEQSEERKKALDQELDATRTRMDQLRGLAAQGSEDAKNNLANELKREADLKLQREKEIQDQKNLELGLAALKAFTANLDGGDGNALGNTIGQVTALLSFISSVSGSFKDGTEDTGRVGQALDKDGGRMAILHDNERVLTKEQNAKIGDLSNDQLANMAYANNHGQVNRLHAKNSLEVPYQSNEEILNAFQSLEATVKANKPPKDNWLWDDRRKMLIHESKKQGKTQRDHIKSNGIWA